MLTSVLDVRELAHPVWKGTARADRMRGTSIQCRKEQEKSGHSSQHYSPHEHGVCRIRTKATAPAADNRTAQCRTVPSTRSAFGIPPQSVHPGEGQLHLPAVSARCSPRGRPGASKSCRTPAPDPRFCAGQVCRFLLLIWPCFVETGHLRKWHGKATIISANHRTGATC